MTISHTLREQIREYANFACEFCGVTEVDTGGQLTIDHQGIKKQEQTSVCHNAKQFR